MHRSLSMEPFRLLFGTKAHLRENPEIRKLIEEEWVEAFQKKRDERACDREYIKDTTRESARIQ